MFHGFNDLKMIGGKNNAKKTFIDYFQKNT